MLSWAIYKLYSRSWQNRSTS
uniref:Uncharacterized protein n=1 Tax=Anguilla anguilla TaxID=7936 RepID=A0A0E9QRV5_ANGAN